MSSDNGQDRTQPSPTLKGDYAPTEFLPASEYPTVIPPTVPARADDFGGPSKQALIGDQMTPDWKAHQESSTKGSAGGFPGRVAPGRALKIVLAVVLTLLVLGVASVLVWSRFNRERGSRNQLSDAVTAAGPSSERSLNYWLTVQKMRDGKPYQEPFESSGQEIFESGYKFRLNVVSPQPGHLYVLNEGLSESGADSFTWIYPTPQRNEGSARLDADQQMQTGWNIFGGKAGTEQFWIVWSKDSIAELEEAKEVAFKSEKGALNDTPQAQKVREFLSKYGAAKPEVSKDAASRQTVLRGTGDILVNLVQLEHR